MDNVVKFSKVADREYEVNEEVKVRKNSTLKFKRNNGEDDFDLKFSEFLTKEDVKSYPLLSTREHKISPTRKAIRNTKDYFCKPVAVSDGTKLTKFDLFFEKSTILQIIMVSFMIAMLIGLYFLGACIVPR